MRNREGAGDSYKASLLHLVKRHRERESKGLGLELNAFWNRRRSEGRLGRQQSALRQKRSKHGQRINFWVHNMVKKQTRDECGDILGFRWWENSNVDYISIFYNNLVQSLWNLFPVVSKKITGVVSPECLSGHLLKYGHRGPFRFWRSNQAPSCSYTVLGDTPDSIASLSGELLCVLQNADRSLPCCRLPAHQSPRGVVRSVPELRRVPGLGRPPLRLVRPPQRVSTAGRSACLPLAPGALFPRILSATFALSSPPIFSYSSFLVLFPHFISLLLFWYPLKSPNFVKNYGNGSTGTMKGQDVESCCVVTRQGARGGSGHLWLWLDQRLMPGKNRRKEGTGLFPRAHGPLSRVRDTYCLGSDSTPI